MGGQYKNNIGFVVNGDHSSQEILNFQKQYKLCLAMENDVSDYYITEKVINSIRAQTIPIYYGSKKIDQYINEDKILIIHKDNTERAIDEIRYLLTDVGWKEKAKKANTNSVVFKKSVTTEIERIIKETKEKVNTVNTPICITYDNAPTENTKKLIKTLENNQWEYKLVGVGEEWKGWNGRTQKYLDSLKSLDDNKIVVLSDARDVFCLRSPYAFIDGFKSFGKDIVVSMEIFCEGKTNRPDNFVGEFQCVSLDKYWNHYNIKERPLRQYVNNGVLIGYVHAVRHLLEWSLDNNYTDDQFALGNYVNTFPDKVHLDSGAKLSHTSGFGVNCGMQDLAKQTHDSPTFAELYGRSAFFLHLPGQGIAKGQAYIYKLVKTLLEKGACDNTFRSEYKFREPEWNCKFDDLGESMKLL